MEHVVCFVIGIHSVTAKDNRSVLVSAIIVVHVVVEPSACLPCTGLQKILLLVLGALYCKIIYNILISLFIVLSFYVSIPSLQQVDQSVNINWQQGQRRKKRNEATPSPKFLYFHYMDSNMSCTSCTSLTGDPQRKVFLPCCYYCTI